jgi:ABC-type branched-subunit amino acid transport system substrate-binding protein
MGYQQHQILLAKAIKRENLKIKLLAPISAYSHQLIMGGGKAVEGLICNTYFLPDVANGEGAKFVNLHKEKFCGIEPNFRAASAYDTMFIILKAIEKGYTKPNDLVKFMKNELGKTTIINGASGNNITFDSFGRRTSISIFMITVKNGKFVLYTPEK